MAEEPSDLIPTYGYSDKEPKLFNLKPGKSLPKGYYMNPAMVPGSEAEKQYRADAAREGAPVPWDAPAEKPAAPDVPADPAPMVEASEDK